MAGLNQNYRCYSENSDIESMSTTSRTFGSGLKNSIFGSSRQNNTGLIKELDHSSNIDQAITSSVSRPFGSRLRDEKFKLGYSLQNNERLNDHSTSVPPRIFRSQYSASGIGSNIEDSVRLNHVLDETNYRSNVLINMSSMDRTYGPLFRNTTLSAKVRMQENLGLTEEVSSNKGFKMPVTSKVIRGRNSTLSFKRFSSQNIERYNKNLSNINVIHISRRGLDTSPDSRFLLDGRCNWMDNQNVTGSVLSVTSAKAQFMNMLENLHLSILNIVPNLPDSVRVEFDKAKKDLETINEMSIASVNKADAASEISQSSKFICPQILDHTPAKILDGSLIPLKTGKNILNPFVLKKRNTMSKTNLLLKNGKKSDEKMNPSITATHKNLSSGEGSALVFKRKKSSHLLKIKIPQVTNSLTFKTKNMFISLRQWYPVAVGKDLVFCGIDKGGALVRTEAVKKRVNNRRIELSNGLNCDLIGSPSTTVSVFPKKVISLLKNGLTFRWRVLQKELLNCQTDEDGNEIKESESSNAKLKCKKKFSSLKKLKKKLLPLKKGSKKPPPPKKKKGKLSPGKKHGKINSPSRNETVPTVQTRSSRASPTLFWTAFGSSEVNAALMLQSPEKIGSDDENLVKKYKNTVYRISSTQFKKSSLSQNTKKAIIGIPVKKSKTSSKFQVKKSEKILSPKTSRIASPKKGLKDEKEKKFGDATTKHGKREVRSKESRAKRKREMIGDPDFTRTKRSRFKKKTEAEVESTVDYGEPPSKTKKNKRRTISKKRSLLANDKKRLQLKKKKRMANDKSGQIKEIQKKNDSEDDFESLLDDIQIPKIGNTSSKTKLTRRELKIVSMETPPLKYFNNSLKIVEDTTPVRIPEWSITERTESEIKQFQKRRAEAYNKEMSVKIRKSVSKEEGKTLAQNGDLKNVLDWVAEKNVWSPQWSSRVLQYVMPSRKQMEQEDEDE